MASPLTCTIPEILLEGCQEPCLQAAPASQSPLLPDAVSAESNASSATPHPHPALHPTLQDSCRGLPSSAGSAKKPTQNSFVRASLGQATQPQVPQPSLSNCGPRQPLSPLRLSCFLFCSKESALPGGKLEALENPPEFSYSRRIQQTSGLAGVGVGRLMGQEVEGEQGTSLVELF